MTSNAVPKQPRSAGASKSWRSGGSCFLNFSLHSMTLVDRSMVSRPQIACSCTRSSWALLVRTCAVCHEQWLISSTIHGKDQFRWMTSTNCMTGN